jgi:hypothetical protein
MEEISSTFDLDIHHYSYEDILHLFELENISSLSWQEIQKCKQKVYKLHPDKSSLPPEYFLFYQQAWKLLVDVFQHTQKIHQPVEATTYSMETVSSQDKYIKQQLSSMKSNEFQDIFHKTFETMVPTPKQRENTWFQETSSIHTPLIQNQQQLHQAMETMKQSKRSQQLSHYRGEFQELNVHQGNSLYEEDEQQYTQSDIFSSLSFDDIRRVHKDETMFDISEQDVDLTKRCCSTQELKQFRQQHVEPYMSQPEEYLQRKQHRNEQYMTKKAFESRKKTMEYEEKNKQILSQWLLLT